MTSLLGDTAVYQYGHRSAWRPSVRSTCTRRLCGTRMTVRAEKSKQKVVAVLYKAGKAAENKDLLGCVENELGLREFLEEQVPLYILWHANRMQCRNNYLAPNLTMVISDVQGHEYIVTDDKEGDNSELEKHLEDANILISTPFHPAYLTCPRIKKAKNLKLSITAGVGSDHVDLHAAAESGMTVAEVTGALSPSFSSSHISIGCARVLPIAQTPILARPVPGSFTMHFSACKALLPCLVLNAGSNVVSVAEHVIMLILSMIRNFLPAHKQIVDGGWDIGAAASKAYDLQNKVVGTVGTGRIGQLVLARLKVSLAAVSLKSCHGQCQCAEAKTHVMQRDIRCCQRRILAVSHSQL